MYEDHNSEDMIIIIIYLIFVSIDKTKIKNVFLSFCRTLSMCEEYKFLFPSLIIEKNYSLCLSHYFT